ncbi:MAG TPA: anthranilate phosphoribosyltransferase [Fibrobacteria bacterium]|nr:anthranilate phosphoribosyltransferase [Fibrobacteria bacterium]
MIAPLLGKLIKGEDLAFAEMQGAMAGIMEGRWTPAQIGGFLIALRIKGETPQEIAAAVTILREKATLVPTSAKPVVDTCGTGGDHSGSFNISTAAAIVAAGGGVAVAKHGNRAMSSRCGSANVLQELGVNLELTPEQVGDCVDKCRIGFLFASKLHASFKHVAGARQELGQRTIFNLLGPMLNPARARRQLIGVYDLNLTRTLAEVLAELRSEHVMIVAGTDGMDEISLTAPTRVSELKDGAVTDYVLNPQDLGFSLCTAADLMGGDAPANAAIIRGVLDGKRSAALDIVLLNAGAALYVGGVAPDLQGGVALARKSVESGAARKTLEQWVSHSRSFAAA